MIERPCTKPAFVNRQISPGNMVGCRLRVEVDAAPHHPDYDFAEPLQSVLVFCDRRSSQVSTPWFLAVLQDLCDLYDSCTFMILLSLLICRGETGLRSLFL